MAGNNIEFEATRLVRQYSLDAEGRLPCNTVARAVTQLEEIKTTSERKKEFELQEWQKWLRFEDPEETAELAELERECKNLKEAWEDFKMKICDLDRQLPIYQGVPNIWTVKQTVALAEQEWAAKKETRVGKVKDYFFSFCETLDTHSQMFRIFPQGDKYTSLFTGVISSIVKASARHHETAEGFSRALAEISGDMRFIRKQSSIHCTQGMKNLVVKLYIKYFHFLCDAMKWYHSPGRRLRKAFNQKFYTDEVEKKVTNIKIIVGQVVREAALEDQEITRQNFDATKAIHSEIRSVKEQLSNLENLFGKVGEAGQLGLISTAKRLLHQEALADIISGTESLLLTDGKVVADSPNTAVGCSKEELEFESRHLDKYISKPALRFLAPGTESSQVSGEIVARLQSWISAATSQTLWIIGKPVFPSESSIAAAHVTTISSASGTSVLSFLLGAESFGSSGPDSSGDSYTVDHLIALLYSLIRQLISFAPDLVEDAHEIRLFLPLLDGTQPSIPKALNLIQGLLKSAPPLLLCVLDGLHLLDHPKTNEFIDQLLGILVENSGDRVLKILLTTNGFCSAGKKVAFSDRLDCRTLPRKRPGKASPGSRSIQRLHTA